MPFSIHVWIFVCLEMMSDYGAQAKLRFTVIPCLSAPSAGVTGVSMVMTCCSSPILGMGPAEACSTHCQGRAQSDQSDHSWVDSSASPIFSALPDLHSTPRENLSKHLSSEPEMWALISAQRGKLNTIFVPGHCKTHKPVISSVTLMETQSKSRSQSAASRGPL